VRPPAQHRHPVCDRLDLVQLVRDEDHRPTLGRHRPERPEERLRLLRRQHRCGLVEDENASISVERLQDLDALLLTHRELPDPRVRIHREAEAKAEVVDSRLDLARVDDELPRLGPMLTENDVVGDG
jgi:hypothetical protein